MQLMVSRCSRKGTGAAAQLVGTNEQNFSRGF